MIFHAVEFISLGDWHFCSVISKCLQQNKHSSSTHGILLSTINIVLFRFRNDLWASKAWLEVFSFLNVLKACLSPELGLSPIGRDLKSLIRRFLCSEARTVPLPTVPTSFCPTSPSLQIFTTELQITHRGIFSYSLSPTLGFIHPTAPVLLTKNCPVGSLIQCPTLFKHLIHSKFALAKRCKLSTKGYFLFA